MRADAGRAYELEPADSPLRGALLSVRGRCTPADRRARSRPRRSGRGCQQGRGRRALDPDALPRPARSGCTRRRRPRPGRGNRRAVRWRRSSALAWRTTRPRRWCSLSRRPCGPLAGASRRRAGTFAGHSDCWPGSPTSSPGTRPRSASALARAALRLSDVPMARALLAEAAPLPAPGARLSGPAPVDRGGAGPGQRRLGHGRRGGWVLTTAELRVLQFLPSHLSFPEIATGLCVSPNTIKTHARAVYRKLDARLSGRGGPPGPARTGLLDTPASG